MGEGVGRGRRDGVGVGAAQDGIRLSAEDAREEIAADFTEMIFADEKTLRRFVETHSKTAEGRNMLQRLWDAIRRFIASLGKMDESVLPGMGITREQLEKAERLYREVLAEGAQQRTGLSGDGGKTMYDIVVLDDGKLYVNASRKVIKGTTVDEMRNDITAFFKSLLKKQPALDIPTVDGEVLTITKNDTASKARDDHKSVNNQQIRMTVDEFAVRARAIAHIDELSEIASIKNLKRVPDKKNHRFAKDGFSYPKVYFKDFDGQYYEITMSVGHNGTKATVYNVRKKTEALHLQLK